MTLDINCPVYERISCDTNPNNDNEQQQQQSSHCCTTIFIPLNITTPFRLQISHSEGNWTVDRPNGNVWQPGGESTEQTKPQQQGLIELQGPIKLQNVRPGSKVQIDLMSNTLVNEVHGVGFASGFSYGFLDPLDVYEEQIAGISSVSCNNIENITFHEDGNYQMLAHLDNLFVSCYSLLHVFGAPNLANMKSLNGMFKHAHALEGGDFEDFEMGNIESANAMFAGCSKLKVDLKSWNTTALKSADGMFMGCDSFNCDLGQWEMKNLVSAEKMFGRSVFCPIEDYANDGICDRINNIASCNYDGGDCCNSTCIYQCENDIDFGYEVRKWSDSRAERS